MSVEKLRPSFTFNEERIEQLKAVAPEAFADGKINWSALKFALGEFLEAEETNVEHYGLIWPGKREARRLAAVPSKGSLCPLSGEGINEDTTHNVFIEGDNLEVLKLLLKSYAGRIKLIYIDPPYNTGRDFVYPDDYVEPLEAYLKRTGAIEESGELRSTNTRTSGRFHSNWLSMMYPRLVLARSLLSENGVIFISIDDGEVARLRQICDEIFGEDAFVAQIIWKKRSTPPNDKLIGAQHEYILCYAKDPSNPGINLRLRSDEQIARYKNPDNHPKGPWTAGDLMANVKGGRYVESLYFPIVNPRTGQVHYPTSNGNWRFNRERIEQLLQNNEIYFGEDDRGRPKLKRFLSEVKEGVTWTTLWDFVPLNTSGSQEMVNIFGQITTFENPKPSGLLVEILKAGSTEDCIILDFFAGSCTTAHATMQLNLEDGGNRRFIMVQLPESTEHTSEAHRAGYQTIAEIGKERMRRVIRLMQSHEAGQLSINDQNLGFKVFALQTSNFRPWHNYHGDSVAELSRQLDLFETPLIDNWKEHDLLVEVVLLQGFPLDYHITVVEEFTSNVVHLIESPFHTHRLFVCLDRELVPLTIDHLTVNAEDIFVCLDSALTDTAKMRLADVCNLRVI